MQYTTQISVDAKRSLDVLSAMREVRDDLQVQFALNPFPAGELTHILPALKLGLSSDELREWFAVNVLVVFDTACIKHCLKRLEVSVFPNEPIRHQVR